MFLKNFSFLSVANLFVSLLAFVTIPFLVNIFGPETYAIIAFYLAFQTWLVIFDAGFSPTVIRYLSSILISFSKDSAFKKSVVEFSSTYRTLFAVIGILIFLISSVFFIYFESFDKYISNKTYLLPIFISAIAGIRFYVTIEKAIYKASENFITLAKLDILFASLRYFFVVPFVMIFSEIRFYFIFQLIVSIIEIITYRYGHINILRKYLLPSSKSLIILKENFSFFSLSAIAGIGWLMIVSLDKFFLFGNIPASIYTGYSILFQIAGICLIIMSPISAILQPRVVSIFESYGTKKLIHFLKDANLLVLIIVSSILLSLLVLFPLIFNIWTGQEFTDIYETLFIFFLFGYALSALGLISYLFQFCIKNLRVHSFSHIISLLIYAPIVFHFSNVQGLQLIAFSWLFVTFFISQVCALYVFSKQIGIYKSLRIYIPVWITLILIFSYSKFINSFFSDNIFMKLVMLTLFLILASVTIFKIWKSFKIMWLNKLKIS